jgi:hypothetical protein
MYKMVDEMNKMNDFVKQDWLVMEIISEDWSYRYHLFENVHQQLLYLLEEHRMMIDHQHINHHQQDLQEVFEEKKNFIYLVFFSSKISFTYLSPTRGLKSFLSETGIVKKTLSRVLRGVSSPECDDD